MSSVNMKKLGTRRKQELQTALVFSPIAQLNRQQEFLQLIALDPHQSLLLAGGRHAAHHCHCHYTTRAQCRYSHACRGNIVL